LFILHDMVTFWRSWVQRWRSQTAFSENVVVSRGVPSECLRAKTILSYWIKIFGTKFWQEA